MAAVAKRRIRCRRDAQLPTVKYRKVKLMILLYVYNTSRVPFVEGETPQASSEASMLRCCDDVDVAICEQRNYRLIIDQ